jgi:abortive infection bacteriophage resistance protein
LEREVFSLPESTYDKPFKTFDEMIEILESRNITVSDKEFTAQALSNYSYYSIVNGYKNTFLTKSGTDEFVYGTKFEDLYLLNIIDADLNNMIFKYILYIEKSLKSKLSYRISEQYGVFTERDPARPTSKNDYLHKSHYSNSKHMRMNTIDKIRKCIEDNKNKNVIKHYVNDKNHLPAWILTNVVPFGLTINWYRILRDPDKEYICNLFLSDQSLNIESRKEFLLKSFDLSKSYRNIIAHGSKALGLTQMPTLPKNQTIALANDLLSDDEYNHKLGQNDIYSIIIIILTLINDITLLRDFYLDIHVFYHKYKDYTFKGKTIFEVFAFPNDVLKRVEKYLNKKLTIESTK